MDIYNSAGAIAPVVMPWSEKRGNMLRFFMSMIGVLAVFSVYAAGENIPMSRSYVDSALTQKQDPIERTTGANQALTNTGTAGEYGTKGIYNSAAAYAGQTDALIDAATMNTGVQNAIDSEFQCVEWANPNDNTSDCLLMEIVGPDIGIRPGDGEWVRAYLGSDSPTKWIYYNDGSSSIIVPIKPNIQYRLYWDGGYNSSLYRVAFAKTNTKPTMGNKVSVYKSDGTPGSAFRASSQTYPTYVFTVTDDTLKYIVIQITGSSTAWSDNNLSILWDRISHLHLVKNNYLPAGN